MGHLTSLIRATGDELDHFLAHPDDINDFLWDEDRRASPSGNLDKSVDLLQQALDAAAAAIALAPSTIPGELIRTSRGDLYFAIYPEKLQAMSDETARISRDAIVANLGQDHRDYAMHNYDNLVRFLQDAAQRGYGAIISHA